MNMRAAPLVCPNGLRERFAIGFRGRCWWRIPFGLLFEFVSYPNCIFEVLAWVGLISMMRTIAGILCMLVGTLQMLVWVRTKHRQYLKEFGTLYPWSRKRMFPFVFGESTAGHEICLRAGGHVLTWRCEPGTLVNFRHFWMMVDSMIVATRAVKRTHTRDDARCSNNHSALG